MKMPFIVRPRFFLTLAFVLLCSLAVQGMDFQVLHNFDLPVNSPWAGLTQAGDGNFYGMAEEGGAAQNGAVYRIAPDGTLTVVYQLGPNDGSGSDGHLALGTNGWLYGTTYFGGPNNDGTIFKVSTNGQFVTIASFNRANGVNPESGLTLGADGYFYGVTGYGGAYGAGVLYKVSDAGDLQLVFSFSGTNGANPGWNEELCRASDGNLYGTTREGGLSGGGVIFKVDGSGGVSTIVDLGATSAGTHPLTGLVQGQDGLLYGSTDYGGAYGGGAVFNMDLVGNITNLASFDGTNVAQAESTLIQANDGNFYATSSEQVMRFTPGVGLSVVYAFPAGSQVDLEGRLMQGPDGYLYGTSYTDNVQDYGFVYKVSPDGSVETNITFMNLGGSYPQPLAFGNDGNIYGACSSDGTYGYGTLFRMTPDGSSFTTLYYFDATNGNGPGGLINGSDGNFYGTTAIGGTANGGTIFQITTNGVFTLIYSMDGTNWSDPNSLLRTSDGTFYGTGSVGGSFAGGMFKLDTNGVFTTLHVSSGATGNYPGGMLQGLDGNFYGTALNGPYQAGVIWELTPGGAYSMLHAFTSADGDFPTSLVQDAFGVFYGTVLGGPQAVFSLATNGSITNIGSIPDYQPGGIHLGVDGNIYGSSSLGGNYGRGSVWVMNRNGRLARLVSFNGSNGNSPSLCSILRGDGRLYGTANGGPRGGGVIFAIALASPEIIAQPLAQGIFQNGNATLDVIVCSTNSVTYQWRRSGQDIPGATNVSFSITNAQGNDFANYSVAVTSGGTTVISSNAPLTMLPARPLLSVQQQQKTNIVLSWAAAYTGFNLQQSTILAAKNWQPVTNNPTSNSHVFSVTIPITPGTNGIFYRLQK